MIFVTIDYLIAALIVITVHGVAFANTDLLCHFPVPVDCVWLRNRTAVAITGRYSYVTARGTSTTDCSLRIKHHHPSDTGRWICTHYTNEDDSAAPMEKTVMLGNEEEEVSVDIVDAPSSTFVILDDRVRLKCVFREPVICVWFRGDHVVHLPSRHIRYLGNGLGRSTTDCSIEIERVRPADLRAWRCGNVVKDHQRAVMSKAAWIYSREVSLVQVNMGKEARLDCFFPLPIEECVWRRPGGQQVRIARRFRYISGSEGRVTQDCAILVSEVRRVDLGMWECSAVRNNFHGYTSVTRIILNSPDPVVIEHPPAHLQVSPNATVELPCRFDIRVFCLWLHEGVEMHVGYRFSYPRGSASNVSDCTLRIDRLTHSDTGRWRCGSLAEDGRTEVLSRDTKLTLKHPLDGLHLLKPPADSGPVRRVASGETVTLPCVFNQVTSGCAWYRRGQVIRSSQDSELHYSYATSGSGNCSLTILDVTAIDSGRWSCATLLDDSGGPQVGGDVLLEINESRNREVVVNVLSLTFAIVGATVVIVVVVMCGVIRVRRNLRVKKHDNGNLVLGTDKLTGQINRAINNIYKACPISQINDRGSAKRPLPDTPDSNYSSSAFLLLPSPPSTPNVEDSEEETDAAGYIRVSPGPGSPLYKRARCEEDDPQGIRLPENAYEDPAEILALPTRSLRPLGTIAKLTESMRRCGVMAPQWVVPSGGQQ